MANDGISDEYVSRYKVPNLERALLIMEYLLDYPDGLGVTELTNSLGYPKNSIFRITMTLHAHGYLTRDEKSKKFCLSRKLLAMGNRTISEQPIIPAALDIMRECRDEVKETVLIGSLIENEGVVMEQILGSHAFKFSMDLGVRFKLHVSAPGKAILAYLPERECDALLDRLDYQRYNERTITTKAGLLEELRQIRESGFSLDRAEQLHGIACVGAPVFNQHGYPVAGLWTTGPADRITESLYPEFGKTIRKHADNISSRLGYSV